MSRHLSFAILFVVLGSISTGASAKNGVYRCGSSYSQKPCTDAVVVDVQDARTQAQKVQADAAIRRDTATGNAMEKERLAREERERAAQARLAAADNKQSAPQPKKAASAADTKDTAKRAKAQQKKRAPAQHTPEVFVASEPGTKIKPKSSKAKQP